MSNSEGIQRSDTAGTLGDDPGRLPFVRRQSQGPGIVGRVRGMSLSQILDANPAPGMWAATGAAIAHAPNLTQLQDPQLSRNISFNAQGHNVRTITVPEDSDAEPEFKGIGRVATFPMNSASATIVEEKLQSDRDIVEKDRNGAAATATSPAHEKHTWSQTIVQGLKAFWKFFLTPSGFLITIYGLNIVAWGAMLFFLLLNAAPAMNHPSADDDNSPRKIWLEIDSQILNALFCVTGFGLAPWRHMDLYLSLRWRFTKNEAALKKLAGKNVAWFRLPHGMSEPSLTVSGKWAEPTSVWKLDAVVWLMASNTWLQCVLCFFMWHYNRINRPTWATGTFIALGCGVAMIAGVITWWEGRKVKKIEGPQLEVEEKVEPQP